VRENHFFRASSDLVFPSTQGTFVDVRNLTRDFKMMLKTAGLADIRFHDLRHTAASIMLMNGVPVIRMAEILGNSPAVTLKTYSHFIREQSNAINLMMDEVCRPSQSPPTSK
jgi:site-specific recombinase XerD